MFCVRQPPGGPRGMRVALTEIPQANSSSLFNRAGHPLPELSPSHLHPPSAIPQYSHPQGIRPASSGGAKAPYMRCMLSSSTCRPGSEPKQKNRSLGFAPGVIRGEGGWVYHQTCGGPRRPRSAWSRCMSIERDLDTSDGHHTAKKACCGTRRWEGKGIETVFWSLHFKATNTSVHNLSPTA